MVCQKLRITFQGRLSVGSLNVRGLRQRKKRCAIKRYLDDKNIDICILQETHSTSLDEITWTNEWKGHWAFSHGSRNARGTAIWSRTEELNKVHDDNEGRLLKVKVGNMPLEIIGVYAPTQDKGVEQLRFF